MRFVSMAIVSMAIAGAGAVDCSAEDTTMTVGDQTIRDLLGEGAVTVRLWPGEAPDGSGTIGAEVVNKPDEKRKVLTITNVTQPTITLIPPAKSAAPTAAVLV